MKTNKIFIAILFALPVLVNAQNEVCPSNGISTNPDNPTNTGSPDSKFINHFNWFEQAVNNVLFELAINGMNDYFPLNTMLNPYDDANNLCYYLGNADLNELDVYPEDGWELLLVNLDKYPDGVGLQPSQCFFNSNLNNP